MSYWTLEKVLDLALKMEEQSIRLYSSAQGKAVNPGSRQFLKELARQEESHRMKIMEALRDPNKIVDIGSLDKRIQDLKIIDGLEKVSLAPEAEYQQILIYAAKRELETHDLYMEMAKRFRGKPIDDLFRMLAVEELKHKHDLEREYDDIVLREM